LVIYSNMDTSIDTSTRKTVKIIGRKPTIKLFNERHNVATVNTQPPATPRTRRHYKQNTLNKTNKKTQSNTAKTAYQDPHKSKIKVGVCGMYGGSTNTGAKGSKDQFTLERRRTERKHISEDSMFSGPRSDRAFKEGKNHRMHCKGNGDQLVRCSPNTRVSTPMSNRGLKCYSPSGRRPAPFGMDTHVHMKSPGGKRTTPQRSTRNMLC